jgi:hypothetical protein
LTVDMSPDPNESANEVPNQCERGIKMRNQSKKFLMSMALAAGISGSVIAADLGNLSGQSCGDLTGTWHFINNQTGNAAKGKLSASFSGGVCVVDASTVLKSTQHFYCTAPGTLTGASTDLPGKLVLSDFSCETKCDIDPKTNACK